MIYAPDLTNYKCFVVQSEGVIRAYQQIPTNNSTINYRDYYINSDYIYKDGTQTFSQYTNLPICLSNDSVTDNVFYRIDFPDIVSTLFYLICLTIIPCYLLITRFMRRLR